MSACRDFTVEELGAVLDACTGRNGIRDRTYLHLAICTGFRVSELLQLTRADVVDYRGQVPTTLDMDRRKIKKKREGRSVPIHEALRKSLLEWLVVLEGDGFARPTDPLFPNRKTRRALGRSSVWKMIRHRATLARIDINRIGTHSARKTLAAAALAHYLKARDIQYLQKIQALLGHAEITSTMKYLRSISVAEQMDGFDAAKRFVFGEVGA